MSSARVPKAVRARVAEQAGHRCGYVVARDPLTGEWVALFNPRRQRWRTHFVWIEDGARIMGLTPTARATVVALHLNRALLVGARQAWVQAGWHPPADKDDDE